MKTPPYKVDFEVILDYESGDGTIDVDVLVNGRFMGSFELPSRRDWDALAAMLRVGRLAADRDCLVGKNLHRMAEAATFVPVSTTVTITDVTGGPL